MRVSRLILAAVIAVRSVLVYGEAAGATSAQLTWHELLPARRRRVRTARFAGTRAPVRAVTGPSA